MLQVIFIHSLNWFGQIHPGLPVTHGQATKRYQEAGLIVICRKLTDPAVHLPTKPIDSKLTELDN